MNYQVGDVFNYYSGGGLYHFIITHIDDDRWANNVKLYVKTDYPKQRWGELIYVTIGSDFEKHWARSRNPDLIKAKLL